MSVSLRVIIFVSALIFTIIVLNTLKKKKITAKLSLLWLCASIGLMVASIFSKEVIWISNWIGFEEASNMVFFFGVLVLLLICFCLCIVISKQQRTITILIQELSLLKNGRTDE